MRNALVISALLIFAAAAARADLSTREAKRIQEAAEVLREIHAVPDRDIPEDLWNRAKCVIVVPSLKKAAFVFGGEYGKGLMSCRKDGDWAAPVFMMIGKGSWGLQIGAESIDLILIVTSERGMQKLLHNKTTLGAEASAAAGPVGRDARAATDAQMHAEILSYSRTQGLFAGLNLSGGVVKTDDDDTRDMYGKSMISASDVINGSIAPPSVAEPFMAALRRTKQ
jgi:lipid-binding SYLF domain-containing protein